MLLNMKTRFLFIALGILGSSLSYSQHRIYGKVSDSSGEPLSGATVLIKGTYSGKVTNQRGEYVFSDLADGDYE